MKNVLIYPASTEIGLEYGRALKHSKEFRVFGASETGAAELAFENFIPVKFENIPDGVRWLIDKYKIDWVFPAHDQVLYDLRYMSWAIPQSNLHVVETCSFKSKTYEALAAAGIKVPGTAEGFPCFAKPDRGQGSRGAKVINNQYDYQEARREGLLLLELLDGDEFTVDCFTNGSVKYCQPRYRKTVSGGISTLTENIPARFEEEFLELAQAISNCLQMHGAWFFQAIRSDRGIHVLECAPRISGNSGLCRADGVNLPLLSLHMAMKRPVEILPQRVAMGQYRTLDQRVHYKLNYNVLYVDFDDTLIVNGRINTDLVKLIYQCKNQGKWVVLVTKHVGDIDKALKKFWLSDVFDDVYQIPNGKSKSDFMVGNSILIDDSFTHRKVTFDPVRNIHCFGPEVVPCLTI